MADADRDYELYVSKYARDRDITPEEAKSHALVKEYEKYCKEEYSKDES